MLLLNFNLNDILRKICQKSRDEGKELDIENNNGKRMRNATEEHVKQNRNKHEKDEGTVTLQQSEKGNKK